MKKKLFKILNIVLITIIVVLLIYIFVPTEKSVRTKLKNEGHTIESIDSIIGNEKNNIDNWFNIVNE